MAHEEPPGYQQKQRLHKPKLEAFLPIIHEILEQDKEAPPKQRHTIKQIFDRLRTEHGYTGDLERESQQEGRREFIKVLRLLEKYSPSDLGKAITRALEIRALTVDAIRLLAEQGREEPSRWFCVDGRPHLEGRVIPPPKLDAYTSLTKGGATMKPLETKSVVLLQHHLKALRLPTMHDECEKMAQRCAKDSVDHLAFLLQLCELELLDRDDPDAQSQARELYRRLAQGVDRPGRGFLAVSMTRRFGAEEIARISPKREP